MYSFSTPWWSSWTDLFCSPTLCGERQRYPSGRPSLPQSCWRYFCHSGVCCCRHPCWPWPTPTKPVLRDEMSWLRAPEGPILILHGWGAKGSLESSPPKANCRFLACYNLISPAFVSRQSIDLLWRRILRNYSLLDTRYLHVRPFKMGHNQA